MRLDCWIAVDCQIKILLDCQPGQIACRAWIAGLPHQIARIALDLDLDLDCWIDFWRGKLFSVRSLKIIHVDKTLKEVCILPFF